MTMRMTTPEAPKGGKVEIFEEAHEADVRRSSLEGDKESSMDMDMTSPRSLEALPREI